MIMSFSLCGLNCGYELAEYKNAIMAAMYKGAKREIQSEDEPEAKKISAG